MQRLSITTAWNEAAAFVQQNAGPLFTIAFALMVLPGVIFQVLMPHAGTGGAAAALTLLGLPVMMVLSLAGSIAISALALRLETVFGSAIRRGFRRLLPLLLASILLAVAVVLIALPLILLLGVPLEELAGPTPSPEVAGRFVLLFLVLLILFVALWVRLMLMTPVAAAEQAGPIALIRRSWQLTGGHFWKLLGFVLLFAIAFAVVVGAATAILGIVIGIVAGGVEPGSLGSMLLIVVSGLLNAFFIVLMTAMIARIYAQLTGGQQSAVFD